ncbi:MAG: BamA/TamA family outer membrane protein, partial [Bacteroidota bacterium]
IGLDQEDDNTVKNPFKRYLLSRIAVDIMPHSNNDSEDQVEVESVDSLTFQNYQLNYFPPYYYIQPTVILKNTYLKPLSLFSQQNTINAFRRFSALNTFALVDVQYELDSMQFDLPNSSYGYLNAKIQLKPFPDYSFQTQFEGTKTGDNFGVLWQTGILQRNLFFGAEQLNLSTRIALESHTLYKNKDQTQDVTQFLAFNAYEISPELTLKLPYIIRAKYFNFWYPSTELKLSYLFQKVPDYSREVFKFSFSQQIQPHPYHYFTFTPLELSQVKVKQFNDLKEILNIENNFFLRSSFSDQFIAAMRLNYTFNNTRLGLTQQYFSVSIEEAGNLLSLFSASFSRDERGAYLVNKTPFAQYIRGLFEFKNYYYIARSSQTVLVNRLFFGIGVPYGNSQGLPFEKSFFAGGVNGLRGFLLRGVGPGSVPQDSISSGIFRIGQMHVETNLEFRFSITKVIKWAFFTDLGNVWNVPQQEINQNGSFKFSRFWKDLAWDIGTGLRLDFNFLILRLDVASAIKNPTNAQPEAIRLYRPNWNIAINYPF